MSDEKSNFEEQWFSAAIAGDQVQLNRLLISGVDINMADATGCSALHHATMGAHLSTMQFLIEHGADLNMTNDKLSTPLHLTEKNIDAIRILLEAGADPNLKDADWDYPYYFAFYGSMTRELTELYIKHGARLKFVDS